MALGLRRMNLVLDQFVSIRRRRPRMFLSRPGRRRRQSARDHHLAALVVRVEVGRGERAGEDLVVLVPEAHVAQNGTADLRGKRKKNCFDLNIL